MTDLSNIWETIQPTQVFFREHLNDVSQIIVEMSQYGKLYLGFLLKATQLSRS